MIKIFCKNVNSCCEKDRNSYFFTSEFIILRHFSATIDTNFKISYNNID